MSIKYNQFGEVVSVNGIVTGHHLGAPMQDAKPKRAEDNDVYATEMSVQTTISNSDELLEEQPKPSGGASSWNDLTDRPFGEETVIVNEHLNIQWDGNTDGLISAETELPFSILYKVSDIILDDETLKKCEVGMNGSADRFPLASMWDVLVSQGYVTDDYVSVGEDKSFPFIVVVRKENAIFQDFKFPETGIYFFNGQAIGQPGYLSALTCAEPIEMTQTVIKIIDSKYLPSSGGLFLNVSKNDSGQYVADHTYLEVYNSIMSGQNTAVGLNVNGIVHILLPYYLFNGIKFTSVISGGAYEQYTVTVNTDDSVSVETP